MLATARFASARFATADWPRLDAPLIHAETAALSFIRVRAGSHSQGVSPPPVAAPPPSRRRPWSPQSAPLGPHRTAPSLHSQQHPPDLEPARPARRRDSVTLGECRGVAFKLRQGWLLCDATREVSSGSYDRDATLDPGRVVCLLQRGCDSRL